MEILTTLTMITLLFATYEWQPRTQSEVINNPQPASQQPAPPVVTTTPTDRSQWPTVGQRFKSFIQAVEVIKAEKPPIAVLFIMDDSCPACQKTTAFWQTTVNPIAFYVIDGAQIPGAEFRALEQIGFPTQVPSCLLVEDGKMIKIGLGVDECTTGLLGPSL